MHEQKACLHFEQALMLELLPELHCRQLSCKSHLPQDVSLELTNDDPREAHRPRTLSLRILQHGMQSLDESCIVHASAEWSIVSGCRYEAKNFGARSMPVL